MITVISRPDHEVRLEFADGRVWLHHTVTHWNRTVKRNVERSWEVVLRALEGFDIWVLCNEHENPMLEKYISRFGFIYIGDEPDETGEMRKAFKRPN